jgi:hypothetical protein
MFPGCARSETASDALRETRLVRPVFLRGVNGGRPAEGGMEGAGSTAGNRGWTIAGLVDCGRTDVWTDGVDGA